MFLIQVGNTRLYIGGGEIRWDIPDDKTNSYVRVVNIWIREDSDSGAFLLQSISAERKSGERIKLFRKSIPRVEEMCHLLGNKDRSNEVIRSICEWVQTHLSTR